MSIWQKIKDAMINKQASKPTITNVPLPVQTKNINNPSQTGDKVYVANAQSWNQETHPEGRGDSYLVQDIDYNNGKLDVTYRDGFTAEYDNISPQDAKEFAQADSKGRWALKHLWDSPYKKV